MGTLEAAAKRRRKKHDIQNAVFNAVGAAGIIAVAIVAPNALQLLRYVPANRFTFDSRAKSALHQLAKKGLVTFVERDGKRYARLTKEGETAFAFEREMRSFQEVRKRRWDKQWRMVLFDIPERRRKVRLRLRTIMREIGFVRVQDSAWVYPYDCEEFVALLKAELKIGKDVLYVIVSEMEYDRPLRTHFRLPLA